MMFNLPMASIIFLFTILHSSFSMREPRDPHIDLPLMKNGLPETNDSHGYLNSISQFKKSGISQAHYENSQMPLEYTGRRKFIRLMHNRDQSEEKVTDYVKAGKVISKANREVATIMFDRAFQHRSNSQAIQRQMEGVKSKSFQVDLKNDTQYMQMVCKHLKKRKRTLKHTKFLVQK